VLSGEIRNDASAGAPNYTNVFRIALNPSGHLLAAELGDDGSSIRIWNTATGQLVKEIGAGEHLSELYWTSDTQLIARTVWNNNVWIWEAGNWENFQTINLDAFEAEHLDISADGKRVALIREDTLEIRELKSGKKLYSWKIDWEPKMDLAWSPDGTRIVLVDTEKFTVYEAGTGKRLNSLKLHVSQFGGLKWSPDSSSIAYLIKVPESASASRRGMLANEVYLWRITSADARLVTRTPKSAYLLSKDNFGFSPDSKSLALALWQKGLIVLRLP
jgi:WD40 repeat protein